MKGSALFTLSLPVTRKELIGARAATGLAQCFAIAMIPPLVIPLLAPAIGQHFSVVDALAHGLCLFFVAAVFYSLASFLSTLFADIWRPLLIAFVIACAPRSRRSPAATRHLPRDERRDVLQDGIAAVGGIPDKRGTGHGVAVQRGGNSRTP